jgi:hypothetical protein
MTQLTENHIKKTYDMLLKSGMFWKLYPQLTGNWEEDKEFWEEEYLEQQKRFDNEH